MAAPSSTANGLATFVHGTLDPKLSALIREAVPAAWHHRPPELTANGYGALLYERLREANRALPDAVSLLADPRAMCAALARAATISPPLFHLMLLHYTLGVAPLVRFGDPDLTVRHLAALQSMAVVGCPLITESGRSNSQLAPRTTATYDPARGGFILSTPDAAAAKAPTITGHPRVGKLGMVFARLIVSAEDRGVFVFAVPLREIAGPVAPGVRITPLGESSALPVDCAAVAFDGVELPFDAWLRDGAYIAPNGEFHDLVGATARLTRTMSVGPATWQGIVAMAAAISRSAAAVALRYSVVHTTAGGLAPGRALIDHGNQRDAMLTAYATACALTAAAHHAAGHPATDPTASHDADRDGGVQDGGVQDGGVQDGGVQDGGVHDGAAQDVVSQGTASQDTASREAVPKQADGGRSRRAGTWSPWASVDRELALLKVAATELAEHVVDRCRRHCGATGAVGTDLFNAYRGLAHAYITAGGDNQLTLLDAARAMADVPEGVDIADVPANVPAHPLGLVDCRELARCAEGLLHRRLRNHRDDAWNGEYGLAIDAATMAAERQLLEIVGEAVSDVAGDAGAVLEDLAVIFALDWVERRAALLLDLGLLPPDSLARVRVARAAACGRLVPHIPVLFAAFDIPEELQIG